MTAARRLGPFALYLLLAFLVGTWIVDDAGISYAYARNLADGYGLVSQPGRPPVEGFSNFLWVVLLSPLMLLRVFDPIVVPKAVSAALVLASLLIIQRSLRRETGSEWPGWFAAAAIALSPPIVIWTMSGLENALTLLLATAFAVQLVERPNHWAIKAGVLCSLLAMTHPELILLFGTGFVVCLADARRQPKTTAAFTLSFAIPTGAFFACRLAMFGLPLPHTYYAKRTTMSAFERLAQVIQSPQEQLWNRTLALAQGLGGIAGVALVACLLAAGITLVTRRRMSRAAAVWLLLALNATTAYLWMDDDWMGEFRFATVVVLATFVAAALVGDAILRIVPVKRAAAAAVAGAAIAAMAANAVPRITAFAATPTTPYADVSRRIAGQFEAYAGAVEMQRPSILVADIGATLFESTTLRVYDLAGLCEPDLVHTLKKDTQYWLFDHPEFYDWVFERIKPTFISTERFWTYVAAFEKDPRFRRDYVAINVFPDAYIQNVFQQTMRSGDFVRRDALPHAGVVEHMRQAYQPAPRPDMAVAPEAPQDRIAAAARALDAGGRPHDARGLWRRVADMGVAGGPAAFFEAFDRLGDNRVQGRNGDALDADMAAGLRLLYTERRLEPALAAFEQILQANPSHYGALYQRARTLTLLGRGEPARTAWRTVALVASRISDTPTVETALAELGSQ